MKTLIARITTATLSLCLLFSLAYAQGNSTVRGQVLDELGYSIPGANITLTAADGKVRAHIHRAKLEDINQVFSDLKAGSVDGRMVVSL